MVVIFIIILSLVTVFSIYTVYNTLKYGNIFHTIKSNKKGFFWIMLLIIGSLVGIYFCIVTPTSFIRNEYSNKDGIMTVVEYSISGDSTIVSNIRMPKKTYGILKNVRTTTRMFGRVLYDYTIITVQLNDGRILDTEINGANKNIENGNGMSVTETYYPSYNIEYNFN